MGRIGQALFGLAVLLAAASAHAQAPPPPAGTPPPPGGSPPPAAAPVQPPPEAPAPPYEQDLLRLAEVLGALHHLRPVCGSNDGARWRSQMQALLDAEGTSPERKERLAGAFNASFGAYSRSYTSCTPAAELVIRRFLGEGARIAREVAARYSN